MPSGLLTLKKVRSPGSISRKFDFFNNNPFQGQPEFVEHYGRYRDPACVVFNRCLCVNGKHAMLASVLKNKGGSGTATTFGVGNGLPPVNYSRKALVAQWVNLTMLAGAYSILIMEWRLTGVIMEMPVIR
jgi:hypothetical protein